MYTNTMLLTTGSGSAEEGVSALTSIAETPQEIISNTQNHVSNDLWERIIALNNGSKKHYREHLKELRIGQKKYFQELKKIRQAGLLPYETKPRPTATEYDELKRRILELHDNEMDGVKIGEELGVTKYFVSKVLVKHKKEGNKVETVGMLKKIRIINESNKQLQWYRNNGLYPPIKRDMYYRLKELGFIKKSDANYKSFCTLTAEACRGVDSTYSEITKLPRMELGDFKDDRWQQPLGSCDMDDSPTQPTPAQAAEDSSEYIQDKIGYVKYILTIIQNRIQDLKDAPSDYDGSITEGKKGEDPGFWYESPIYIEFWCESNAFREKLEKFQGEKKVKVRSNGGFSSVDKYRRNCEDLKDWVTSHPNIEKVIIKYWGDLDASGHFLDTNVMRALKFYITGELSKKDEEPENPFTWNGIEFEFQRVAILEEHVEDFGGEPLVQEDEDMQKGDEDVHKGDEENHDSRFETFKEAYPKLIEQYGDKFGVQLEAMTTTDDRLKAFKELVENTTEEDWDEDVYYENCPPEEYDYDENGEEEPEEVDPDDVIPDMITEITNAFHDGWEKDEGFDYTVPQITDAFKPGWWKEIEDYTQYDIDDEDDGT